MHSWGCAPVSVCTSSWNTHTQTGVSMRENKEYGIFCIGRHGCFGGGGGVVASALNIYIAHENGHTHLLRMLKLYANKVIGKAHDTPRRPIINSQRMHALRLTSRHTHTQTRAYTQV